MKISNELFFEQIEQLLAEGTSAEFMLRGDSMLPLLRNQRECVVIAPVDPSTIAVGDVLLFRFRGIHLLHRVRRIEGDSLVMVGDGNYHQYEICQREDVVGRMERFRRPSGRMVECTSRRWRWASQVWCSLPPLVRRLVLGILRRIPGQH